MTGSRAQLLRDALAQHRAVLVRTAPRRGHSLRLAVVDPVALAPDRCLAWSRRDARYVLLPFASLRDVRASNLASPPLPPVPPDLAVAAPWTDTSLPRPDGSRPVSLAPGPGHTAATPEPPRGRRPGLVAAIPAVMMVLAAVAILYTLLFR